MFRRIMLSVLVAGGLAGLFASGLQQLKVVPLILQAETYEQAAEPAAHVHAEPAAHVHAEAMAEHGHDLQAWAPAEGSERIAFTVAANLLAGIGFASLLVGAIALSGREVGPGEGVLWGLAGFAAFTLAPALGLPPELPGIAAGDLHARQAWWVATALATAAGLGLTVFARSPWRKVAGLVLIAVPHLAGAPEGGLGSAVPAELMAHFAIASVVVAGLFWVALGGLAGAMYRRLGRA